MATVKGGVLVPVTQASRGVRTSRAARVSLTNADGGGARTVRGVYTLDIVRITVDPNAPPPKPKPTRFPKLQ